MIVVSLFNSVVAESPVGWQAAIVKTKVTVKKDNNLLEKKSMQPGIMNAVIKTITTVFEIATGFKNTLTIALQIRLFAEMNIFSCEAFAMLINTCPEI